MGTHCGWLRLSAILVTALRYSLSCPQYTVGDLPLTGTGRIGIPKSLPYIQLTRVKGSALDAEFFADCEGGQAIHGAILFTTGFNVQGIHLQENADVLYIGLARFTTDVEYTFTARDKRAVCDKKCLYETCRCDIDGGFHCVTGMTGAPQCSTLDGSGLMVNLATGNLSYTFTKGDSTFSIPNAFIDYDKVTTKKLTRHGNSALIYIRRHFDPFNTREMDSILVGEERVCCSATTTCRLFFQLGFDTDGETTLQYLQDVDYSNVIQLGVPHVLSTSGTYESCVVHGDTEGHGANLIVGLQVAQIPTSTLSSVKVSVKVDTDITVDFANRFMQQLYSYKGAYYHSLISFPVVVTEPTGITATLVAKLLDDTGIEKPKFSYDGVGLHIESWGTFNTYFDVFVKVGATDSDILHFTSPDVLHKYLNESHRPYDIMVFDSRSPIHFVTKNLTTIIGCIQSHPDAFRIVCDPLVVPPDYRQREDYKKISIIIGASAIVLPIVGAIVTYFRHIRGQVTYDTLS